MNTTDPTPYTPTDEDMEDRYVRHSLALVDFPLGDRPEWEQKLRVEFRRGLARVRAEAVERPSTALVELSQWIDAGNAHRDPEAVTWGRLAKLAEEVGEVIAAYIGATGQNPRKGVTHWVNDVRTELLDVAVTALGAYEHLDEHQGRALSALTNKIEQVIERAHAASIEQETKP